MKAVSEILGQQELSRQDIVRLLSITDQVEQDDLIKKAYAIKASTIGTNVYLRGLIEFSNRCQKNCFYCGIRNENHKVTRYSLSDEEIIQVIELAQKNQFTGIVLQSGEIQNPEFTNRITRLLFKIKKATTAEFRITLSLGEQSLETYQDWFHAGAQRYLLRIETSSEELYKKIHPDNELHNYKTRLKCLENIQKVGYQTGTGVMIGLPFQSIDNLADDLLLIKQMDIDMVGMGPHLEHADTPLYHQKDLLMPIMDRFALSIRMIAVLRIMMPTINIASTTALQSIVAFGREWGLKSGANVLMPNLTPEKYKSHYLLYENKPCIEEEAHECIDCLANKVQMVGEEIAYGDYGDSKHFIKIKRD
ncbi:MAG TPA: [FeFe] hydrogenase H-cluster radical SAM maturase HydE [Prolixibacteraceae bacterium]|jgi:biotin synthase